MSYTEPTLHMLCGLIASGKSTLAKKLSEADQTVLISEDDWLKALYADQLSSGADYLRCAARLQAVMGPHVAGLLKAGLSVVLDFPANTVDQRKWMQKVVAQSGAAHRLHLLNVASETCLNRLRARNAKGTHAFTVSDAQFHKFARHFAPPEPEEGFSILMHDG